MNNSLGDTISFTLIIAKSMKLFTDKLCVVCLGGVIVVNYGNKCLFPKLCQQWLGMSVAILYARL
jgi:hypothetical protein